MISPCVEWHNGVTVYVESDMSAFWSILLRILNLSMLDVHPKKKKTVHFTRILKSIIGSQLPIATLVKN